MNNIYFNICNIILNIISVICFCIFCHNVFFNFILQLIICDMRLRLINNFGILNATKKDFIIIFYTVILTISYYIRGFSLILSIVISEVVKYIAQKYNIFN